MTSFLFSIGSRIQRGNDIYQVAAHLEDTYSLSSPSSGYVINSPRYKVEEEFTVLAASGLDNAVTEGIARLEKEAAPAIEELQRLRTSKKAAPPMGGSDAAWQSYEAYQQEIAEKASAVASLRKQIHELQTTGRSAAAILHLIERGQQAANPSFSFGETLPENFVWWISTENHAALANYLNTLSWSVYALQASLEGLKGYADHFIYKALKNIAFPPTSHGPSAEQQEKEKARREQLTQQVENLRPTLIEKNQVAARYLAIEEYFKKVIKKRALPRSELSVLHKLRSQLGSVLQTKIFDKDAFKTFESAKKEFDDQLSQLATYAAYSEISFLTNHYLEKVDIDRSITEIVNNLLKSAPLPQPVDDTLEKAPTEEEQKEEEEEEEKEELAPNPEKIDQWLRRKKVREETVERLENPSKPNPDAPGSGHFRGKEEKLPERIHRRPSNVELNKERSKFYRVGPFESLLVATPIGRKRKLGFEIVEEFENALQKNPEITVEDFHTAVRTILENRQVAYLLAEEKIQDEIADLVTKIRLTQDDTEKGRLTSQFTAAQKHLFDIKKFFDTITSLYKAWNAKMDKESELFFAANIRTIGAAYVVSHINKSVTLETPELSASLKFTSTDAALNTFQSIRTEADVKSAFDVDALLSVEAAAPVLDLSQELNPGAKGASAEDKKKIEEDMIPYLNAINPQGSEADIKAKIKELLYEQLAKIGGEYKEDNVDWMVATIYGAWKAQKAIPAEVGSEGKGNVGVANSQGTGVFVEPARGNDGITKEAKEHGADDIAKGVLIELEHTQKDKSRPATPEEAAAAGKIAIDHIKENPKYYDDIEVGVKGEEKLVSEAELGIIARMVHKSDGWHVLAESGKHLGGPYKTKEAARKRLQQVEMFKHMKSSLGDSMNFEVGDLAILNNRVGFLNEGTEVTVTASLGGEVTFIAGDVHGITKASNLDKVTVVAARPFTKNLHKEMWCTTCGKSLPDQDAVSDCKQKSHLVEILDKLNKEAAWTSCASCGGKETSPRCMHCDGCGRVPINKEAADAKMEKYQWDNDDLKSAFALGDRVKVGSYEMDGVSYKGKEGTIREKVMVSCEGDADMFFFVELDGCGTMTLPADVLSKAPKARALNRAEMEKEAVLKPNFDVVQEFLDSYDHPPTVVTTQDIEAWMEDPKNNYQYTKKDLKEIIKYLQSAKVEVRVPVKKEIPEEPPAETPAPESMTKEAVKYKWTSPDGKQSHEVDHPDDMGNEYTVKDPSTGQDKKYVKATLDICASCSGEGTIMCECMEDANIWMSTAECAKCKDYGTIPCECAA